MPVATVVRCGAGSAASDVATEHTKNGNHMTDTSTRLDKPVGLGKWFIGISVVVALVVGWFSMGQPGIPLHDGDYSCSAGQSAFPGPGATVHGGEVVDVWNLNMGTGTKSSLRWSDLERMGSKKFSLTSADPSPNGGALDHRSTYVCTYD